MFTHALLFAVLSMCPQAADDTSPQVSEFQQLRGEVEASLLGLSAPCTYDLTYSTSFVKSKSSLADALRALTAPESAAEGDAFERADALLSKAAGAQSGAQGGTRRAANAMTFHVQSGRERAAQWCTSDPAYYSVLRTAEQECLYFPQDRRLELQGHTQSLDLFSLSELINPLPASPTQIEQLVTAQWRVEELPKGGRRIFAQSHEGGDAWLRLDVGEAPARLPLACSWLSAGPGTPGVFHTLFKWKRVEGRPVLDTVLRITHQGHQLAVVRDQLDQLHYGLTDSDVRLPIREPRSIMDLTGEKPVSYPSLQELPDAWRSMLLVVDESAAPSGGGR
jgi:hypothetical protein